MVFKASYWTRLFFIFAKFLNENLVWIFIHWCNFILSSNFRVLLYMQGSYNTAMELCAWWILQLPAGHFSIAASIKISLIWRPGQRPKHLQQRHGESKWSKKCSIYVFIIEICIARAQQNQYIFVLHLDLVNGLFQKCWFLHLAVWFKLVIMSMSPIGIVTCQAWFGGGDRASAA